MEPTYRQTGLSDLIRNLSAHDAAVVIDVIQGKSDGRFAHLRSFRPEVFAGMLKRSETTPAQVASNILAASKKAGIA